MDTQEKSQDTVLTNRQIKYLRGIGHKLSPLVLVGKEGISENLLKAVQTELVNHELIKVKVGSNSEVDKKEAARIIPEASESALVQFIGKTLLLYKANPKRPKDKRIHLPDR